VIRLIEDLRVHCGLGNIDMNWPTGRLNSHILSESNIILYQTNEMNLDGFFVFLINKYLLNIYSVVSAVLGSGEVVFQ
jgi:hypothetical protein